MNRTVPYFSSIFEAYRTRTNTKKAYRTSVPYFLAKIEVYCTVLQSVADPENFGGGDNKNFKHKTSQSSEI